MFLARGGLLLLWVVGSIGCAAESELEDTEVESEERAVAGEAGVVVTAERGAFAEFSAAVSSSFQVDAERDGLLVARLPPNLVAAFSRFMHQRYNRCGGFLAHDTVEEARASFEPRALRSAPLTYTLDNAVVVSSLIAQLDESRIRADIELLSAQPSRYYQSDGGVDAADTLKAEWEGFAAGQADFTVQQFAHAKWRQPSVIATLEGTDLKDEVVVMGGHLDSINGRAPRTGIAPGADDDASGIATLTEAMRVMLASGYRPRRTVKFIAYAAEEVGLRGSQEIVAAHQQEGTDVVGVLQLDMVNYKGTSVDIVVISDFTHAGQNAFLGELIDAYVKVPWEYAKCGYGCSDHASWTRAGYVASTPFEARVRESNPNIHSTRDTLANSGGTAEHATKFAKLAVAYVAELAKGTLPPETEADAGSGR